MQIQRKHNTELDIRERRGKALPHTRMSEHKNKEKKMLHVRPCLMRKPEGLGNTMMLLSAERQTGPADLPEP